MEKTVREIYKALHKNYGPQGWWPAESPFEVMVGAVLTQNTNWNNVSRAIVNLKREKLLSPQGIVLSENRILVQAIRPSGFFNQKASYLKDLCRYVIESFNGDIRKMSQASTAKLRQDLLAIRGLGPETVDSILLYACNKPVFVIDAYTRRIFGRHGVEIKDSDYSAWQKFFESHLPGDAQLFNEYHALIVKLAKERCRKRPDCSGCPLEGLAVAQ